MPLVRCPTHDIPYNSENPRGCPACAREKEGGKSQADIMRELARSSQMVRRPETATPQAPPAPRPRTSRSAERPSSANPWVTTPPRKPEIHETPIEKLTDRMLQRRLITVAGALIVILGAWLLASSGPRFVEQPHPRIVTDQALLRPLAVPVNVRMETVFSVLGTQAPRAVPDEPRLQRYSYGTDLEVDAINGRVYAISIRVPSRVWRGLKVGMSETNARGALALLGTPRQFGDPVDVPPRNVGGYSVYPSLDQRPRKIVGVEVRPPNGCFDVLTTVQPKISGLLIDGSRRYAVLGEGSVQPEWLVTQVQIVSRSMRGPYSPGVAC